MELVKKRGDPEAFLDALLKWISSTRSGAFFVEERHVEEFLSLREKPREAAGPEEAPPPRIEVRSPTYEDSRIEGSAEEFVHYFMHRYMRLRGILEGRGIVFSPLSDLGRAGRGELYVSGIVSEVRKTGRWFRVTLEDPEGRAVLRVPAGEKALAEKAELLLPDMVAGFRVNTRGGAAFVRDIVFPDIPERGPSRRSGPDINICVISDLHVGSQKFLRDLFKSFLEWLRSDEEDAAKTRFLIINGDLVDGVFVYPGQERELAQPSLAGQLREAAGLLAEIPRRVEVLYLPGNHEPVRRALPQPPLRPRHREILDAARPITHLGNPALIEVGGSLILAYHGQSFDDIIQAGTRFSYSSLERDAAAMMEFILRCRHLAPTHGHATPILPLREDYLVISEPPSLLATGHIHVAAQGRYKGVALVNTGTWQEQTLYQESIGIEPTLGIAALYNLRDGSLRIKHFT